MSMKIVCTSSNKGKHLRSKSTSRLLQRTLVLKFFMSNKLEQPTLLQKTLPPLHLDHHLRVPIKVPGGESILVLFAAAFVATTLVRIFWSATLARLEPVYAARETFSNLVLGNIIQEGGILLRYQASSTATLLVSVLKLPPFKLALKSNAHVFQPIPSIFIPRNLVGQGNLRTLTQQLSIGMPRQRSLPFFTHAHTISHFLARRNR